MQIRIKLGGELKRYASGSSGVHCLESEEPLSVSEAMTKLGVEEQADEVLVIVNDEVVPPSGRDAIRLTEHDQVTLMPQLKGG